jgi:hypothetical protein
LNSTNRFDMLKKVRQHILANPKSSYNDAIEQLKIPELSTTQFYNVRAQLRRKGQLIDTGAEKSNKASVESPRQSKSTHVEILETIEIAGLSQEIKEHYTTGILPMLRRLVPQGKTIRLAFLSDPPSIEIQRVVI